MTRQISVSPGEKELFEKAKRAALATQRHDWEHGAVAQALLEAGERELAILFAREAANRQAEDGRASHLGDEISEPIPARSARSFSLPRRKPAIRSSPGRRRSFSAGL